MSSVGKTVYKVSDVNHLSFGKIVDEQACGDWNWYQVHWSTKPPTNPYLHPTHDVVAGWFRCDTVKIFKTEDMISELKTLSSQ